MSLPPTPRQRELEVELIIRQKCPDMPMEVRNDILEQVTAMRREIDSLKERLAAAELGWA